MSWIILSVLAGLFFALARVVARTVLKGESNPLAYTAIHEFVAGLVLLPMLLFGFDLPEKGITWLFFGFIVIFVFLCDWLTFLALKKIDISLYQIVIQIRHILILFGGFFFFAETLTFLKILAIVIIIVGVAIAVYTKRRFSWSSGVILAILATISIVISFMFVKITVNDFSEIALASFVLMAVGLLAFPFLGFNVKKINQEMKLNSKGIILSGVLFGIFEVFLYTALKIGDVSKVIPVTQVSLVFAVLIGIFFLKERERVPQKLAGMFVIIVGIILMNFV
ncbi:MAG: DMT family transporter [Candidatus Magasanikbacteria bacterium]|jgi:bacterial/archaeal transporter family protein|nr:DMT family transporter [Candidatus Magasanikbacteria bacterium]MBT4315333.1 DMT family transporter [Candidatus Magasanikbacteria bacterium]MBT4547205.1 DMT family transporter [Candidatus Magasanikbacteria bacterium]MBT6818869.1 DMT family transporter [Candidatus Magasanikbacteria bacterium]